MRLVINIILFLALLLVGAVAFMPKSRLYYYAEKTLEDYKLVVSGENIKESLIDLDVSKGTITYEGAKVAKFESLNVVPLIVTNNMNIENIELLGLAKGMLRVNIDSIQLKENILKPKLITIYAVGSFGEAKGWANLNSRFIHIDIIDPQDIKPIKKLLKKGDKGWYYESKF